MHQIFRVRVILKLKIQNKTVSKSLSFNNPDLNENQLKENIIDTIKDEITNLIKIAKFN